MAPGRFMAAAAAAGMAAAGAATAGLHGLKPAPRGRRRAVALACAEKKSAGAPTAVAKQRSGNINVDQEMLKLRRVFVTGEINDDSAKALVQQLLFLEAEDPEAPVTVFINSGGGLVHSGMAILDMMGSMPMPLKTVAYGRCFSIAALVLAAGTPGHRSACANTRLLIHEPSCSYPKVPTSDMVIKVAELQHTHHALTGILSTKTGRPEAEITKAISRDCYMSAAEAVEFGLVDAVVPSASAGLATRGDPPPPVHPVPAPEVTPQLPTDADVAAAVPSDGGDVVEVGDTGVAGSAS